MPPAEDTQRYLTGIWRMMLGRKDGLALLDISADGFWTSFFAIPLALPALFLGWVSASGRLPGEEDSRLALIVKLALTDLAVWIIPLVALALVAPRIGIGDRVAHCVVSLNWLSALLAWVMLPLIILFAVWPAGQDAVMLISLFAYVTILFFTWRVLDIAIGKGSAIAAGVLAGFIAVSLFTEFGMLDLLGITLG